MTDWADLEQELDAWRKTGQQATFWWRDDDAATATPALRRLFDTASLAAGPRVPLAIAAIPALAEDALAAALRANGAVALQHGYSHANQAAAGGKKAEFGAERDSALAAQELREGARQMSALFGNAALPVLVPPWNRIDPALAGRLAELGIHGLSTYGPRRARTTGSGAIVVNTHVDIIDWRGRRFLGVEDCLRLAIGHLKARRDKRVDPDEATGLLTHHLVHDDDAWSFLLVFLQRTARHPAARWMEARQLFGCSGHGSA